MKETRELKAQVNDSNANRAVKVGGGYNVGCASSASHINYNGVFPPYSIILCDEW